MKALGRGLLWLVTLLLILVGVDQWLSRVPVSQPVLRAVRIFYLDFRLRLLHLLPDSAPASIEAVIEQAEKTPVKNPSQRSVAHRPKTQKKAAPGSTAGEPNYFYADAKGELHFVDSLQEVPERFRKEAQRLAP